MIEACTAEITLTKWSELDGTRIDADARTDISYEQPGKADPDTLRCGQCAKKYAAVSGLTVRTKMAVFEGRHLTRKTKVVRLEVMDSYEVTGNACLLFDKAARILPCLNKLQALKLEYDVTLRLSWYTEAQCMALANRMYTEFRGHPRC